MSRTYLIDTSCLIALACAWHEHHEATRKEIDRRHSAGESPVLAAHSLAEAYSVLTRLPDPHRLRPEDAMAVIEANWWEVPLIALSGAEYRKALRRCRDAGIAGGAVYDALIAAGARKAGVATLLTWDRAVFERFLEDEVVVRCLSSARTPEGRSC